MAAPATLDAYLAALTRDDHRRALTNLRAMVRTMLPDCVEDISYAMPAHRLATPGARKGKVVIGYASFARHCAIYPHSAGVMPRLADELRGWKTSKSGVLFTPDTALPAPLVRRIIDLRLAEIARDD